MTGMDSFFRQTGKLAAIDWLIDAVIAAGAFGFSCLGRKIEPMKGQNAGLSGILLLNGRMIRCSRRTQEKDGKFIF